MSKGSTKRTATARLRHEYMRIKRDPVAYVTAEPLAENILEWHYVIKDPEDSPYEGGYFHGKLVFPKEYPFMPPAIYMITPNGRFQCNTRLCLSISDFHPESWKPGWTVSTILTGLLSFMLERSPTVGSIETSYCTKRQLAAQSGSFNLKNNIFVALFPDVVQEIDRNVRKREEGLQKSSRHSSMINFSSALTNLIVIIGFVAFAWSVKYVLCTLSE